MKLLVVFFGAAVLAFLGGCQTTPTKLPDGVTPTAATWLYGRHTLPATATKTGVVRTFQQSPGDPLWTELAESEIGSSKVPVILYMHGCNGFRGEGRRFRELLTAEGYAFFAPDSFQRPGRKECSQQGRLRDRVSLRLQEVRYALDQIRNMSWVDQDRIILMGFSEGGNTTDNWSEAGFAAHIIIGSACTLVGGMPAAPVGTPVLAVVGSNDRFRPGKSCKIDRTVGGSQSIVLPGRGHSIARYSETKDAVREFLGRCCN